MRYFSLYLCLILCGLQVKAFDLQNKLSGKITDFQTGEVLPGVSVYLPDLKTGAISDKDGNYQISHLPEHAVLVQVSYTGYQTQAVTIDLSLVHTKNFELKPAVREFHDVVVTGMSKATERNRTPVSILSVSHAELLQQASSNLIDAISTQAGVSQISTGAGISKPVIRGLGYNRVLVVNDGIRQEGQQWGDEHGIEIDEQSIHQVEILKGPASLAYGSDAMAGVLNMISFPTLPSGKINGSWISNYQTNNGLAMMSGNIAGNQKGFIWDVRYTAQIAHAYKNKFDGYVYNSGYRQNDVLLTLGLNKSWGYSHLTFSRFHLQPGIIEGQRDSSTGKFVKDIVLNDSTITHQIASRHDFLSYKNGIPFQQIYHTKIVWNNHLNIRNGSLNATLGWQQNKRQEYADVLKPDQVGLNFLLNSLHYDFHYAFAEWKHWNVSTGLGGMYQSSQNKGIEFLVPAYQLFDWGSYLLARKTIGKLDISGGIRYDHRHETATALDVDSLGKPVLNSTPGNMTRFAGFRNVFSGYSGSIGAAWQLSKKWLTKLNLSRGYRAPNIAELSANGIHEGSNRYEIGNAQLHPENSWEIDYCLAFSSEHLTMEVDLFDNNIRHFIFTQALNSQLGGDSIRDGWRAFSYVQGNVNLSGAEWTMDLHPHPLDWLHVENTFSFVQAIQAAQPDSTRYLPQIPPAKWRTALKIEKSLPHYHLKHAYLKVDLAYYFAQHHFYSAYGTETATPAYTLINAGLGADCQYHKHTCCSIYLALNNLFNQAYQSHLSRLKYTDINYTSGRMGVFNVGRNFSIKLIVPFAIR